MQELVENSPEFFPNNVSRKKQKEASKARGTFWRETFAAAQRVAGICEHELKTWADSQRTANKIYKVGFGFR